LTLSLLLLQDVFNPKISISSLPIPFVFASAIKTATVSGTLFCSSSFISIRYPFSSKSSGGRLRINNKPDLTSSLTKVGLELGLSLRSILLVADKPLDGGDEGAFDGLLGIQKLGNKSFGVTSIFHKSYVTVNKNDLKQPRALNRTF
jgi:hypothetical protein